uniref:Uncharacterized protein n=1 Tax=Meloidogyne enterolobii TaxID=390850 RepID=A0A6V7W4E5_MELEN|nr:unnamed protein product [Meloidogyne enterolobii]
MTINFDIRRNYLNVISVSFCTICALFLIILIRPLYKFSKERTALFILFSKSCANIIYQFLRIYMCIYQYYPQFMASFWSHFFISPLASVLATSIYVHITGLAVNRFHAVFLPFSYQKIWKESIFISGVFMYGDLPIVTAIFLSIPLYSAVLSKFIYEYKTGKMQSLENNTKKERIKILAVCLVSLIPCPWYICMYKLNIMIDASVQDTTTSIIVSAIFNTSLTILQCIEEICLIIISEDFRLMIKNQFIKTSTTTKVSTNIVTVKQNSRQEK